VARGCYILTLRFINVFVPLPKRAIALTPVYSRMAALHHTLLPFAMWRVFPLMAALATWFVFMAA
jgi:hypothetical protein